MSRNIQKIGIYLLILIIIFIIALVSGNSPQQNINGFCSFLLLGLWICWSSEFFLKVKKNKEYLSDQNYFSLIVGSLFLGSFYAMWGDFTTILASPSQNDAPILGFNLWQILLALPYLLISTIFLLLCIKKYFFVHIGSKSVSARITSIILSLIFLITDVIYLISHQTFLNLLFDNLNTLTNTMNGLILFHAIFLLFMFVLTLITRPARLSRHSVNQVSNRLGDIDRQIADADRVANHARRRERAAQANTEREQRRRSEEQRTRGSRHTRNSLPTRQTASQNSKSQSKSASTKSNQKSKNLTKKQIIQLKPKTGVLTIDDFKCIFCFELPTTTERHQGIVLCPNCNYPAHVDEFRIWVESSSLCSRCDGEIPASFRRNPKIISTKLYMKTFKYWKKRFK